MIERGSGLPSSSPRRVRQRTGSDVAHHHLEGNDLDLADQLLAHVQPAHEMRRHADFAEFGENVLGDAIVEHALAFDQGMLLVVEGCRIILEMLDERAGLRALRRAPWPCPRRRDAACSCGPHDRTFVCWSGAPDGCFPSIAARHFCRCNAQQGPNRIRFYASDSS